jgi:phosphatidylglycerophosphate synthase
MWLSREEWVRAAKPADTILTVFLVDPVARVVLPLLVGMGVRPNQITLLRLMVGLGTGVWFLLAFPVAGCVGFALWYLLDCLDGKLARLTGKADPFGEWFDRTTDRLAIAFVLVCEGFFFVGIGMSAAGVWVAATDKLEAALSLVVKEGEKGRLAEVSRS